MLEKANAALMERTPFAIDDAGDEDEDDDEESAGEQDEVMDEVGLRVVTSCTRQLLTMFL